MLQSLYDWVLKLSGHRHAIWFLAAIAFVESSVFPIPPHPLVILMVVARPERWILIAAVTTIASVLGGIAGYALGAFLFDAVALPVLDFYGKAAQFDEMAVRFNEYGAWAVLFAGMTPFPYKVITIFSGATGLDFTIFTVASIAARGIIFFAIAALLRVFGPPIRTFIEKRLALMTTIFLVLLFGAFVLVRYIG